MALAGCGRTPATPAPAANTPPPFPANRAVAQAADTSNATKSEEPITAPAEKRADTPVSDAAEAQPTADDTPPKFLLFLPAGPLIVQLNMTIDGRPFHAAREKLVDEVLRLADADHDGSPTWNEIIADSKAALKRRFDLALDVRDRKEFLRTHDTNQNGVLDRDEARRLVIRAKNAGEAFALTSSTKYRNTNQRHSLVLAALDADADGLLSSDELGAADARLLARDANGDAIVTWNEIDDTLAGDAREAMNRSTAYLDQPAALVLGKRADWDAIVYVFSELYLSGDEPADGAFTLDPSLVERLDVDGDGHFTYEEVRGIDTFRPDLVLAANFGNAGELAAGISLAGAAAELGPAATSPAYASHGLTLELGGYRVRFVMDDRGPQSAEDGAKPEDQFAALDADKNGYLESKEVAETDSAETFADWDADGDEKVFLEEFVRFARGRQAPRLSAIQARVGDDHDVLFPLLDANQDGRLTLRELRRCREQLLPLDGDGDGQIDADELPGAITVLLGRGMPAAGRRDMELTSPVAAATPAGPSWFTHLDTNHDDVVSAEEFPGSRTKFDQIDIDRDGFVTISEAQSAAATQAGD